MPNTKRAPASLIPTPVWWWTRFLPLLASFQSEAKLPGVHFGYAVILGWGTDDPPSGLPVGHPGTEKEGGGRGGGSRSLGVPLPAQPGLPGQLPFLEAVWSSFPSPRGP